MKTIWYAAALAALALALPATAQTTAKVLNEQDLTEGALIEALTPASPAEAPVLTRSIRVDAEDAPPSGAGAGATRPSASLLITFETNSASLTARAKHMLNVVGEALRSDKLGAFRFAIQGHADPRGSPAANLRLSQLRAESVRNYLVRNERVEDQRLQAVGKGDTELMNKADPIAPENRRVTIVNLGQ
ncbi:OmpA family protein [Pseudoduganella namucuonensis]|uniref:Outer membrane protein OmpA n=1 Tax=Pseudoduganella namucuonensis TaxID=1035707 RepID=A0A1I7KPW6_9BURK|nr:OmpA family protein [Pseudoduganella namucuonensis]SFU99493.1 Outer membrane protein OmpA [Pseudoduganella namucuonensis]